MIPKPLAAWHAAVSAQDLAPFEALLRQDAVFLSPALHTPQVGRDLVAMYLRGAMMVLGNESFRYVDEWVGEHSAVLEFQGKVDGLEVNGVDILRWDDDGRVTEFKVMVRPFKGLTALMEAMKKLLTASP